MSHAGYTQGAHQWQAVFFLAAVVWLRGGVIGGGGKGLMRQLTGLIAFFTAGYLVLNYSWPASEFLSPHFPALFLLPLAAILIWILSFNLIALVGRLLFKRTRD